MTVIYELSKSGHANKYVDFIRKEGYDNRKIKNFSAIKDEYFDIIVKKL